MREHKSVPAAAPPVELKAPQNPMVALLVCMAAGEPGMREQLPALTRGVLEREQRVAEFLARPLIAERISRGELLVKQRVIETGSEQLLAAFPIR